MAHIPASHMDAGRRLLSGLGECRRAALVPRAALALVALVLLIPLTRAQNSPQVTGVDPQMGKVNDSVTVSGAHLGKASVTAVFLSDDKDDYKATIVEQADDKIVMKVPEVKPGSYNVSVQVGSNIFIKPVHFSVQQ